MAKPPPDGQPSPPAGRARQRRQNGKPGGKPMRASPARAGDDGAASSRPARHDLGTLPEPAVAMAWEMLYEAIRASPEFLPAATAPFAVVILEVPDPSWGEEIALAWRGLTEIGAPGVANAADQPFTKIDEDDEEEGQTLPGWRAEPVRIQAFKSDAQSLKGQLDAFRTGLRRGQPVHAVTSDAAGFLHPDILAAADARLTVSRPTALQLLAMVRKRFGRAGGKLPIPSEAAMGLLQPTDFLIASRREQSPGGFIRKLEQLALARQRPRAPGLETLHGLGEAGAWGRRMAADLRAYAQKHLPWEEMLRGLVLVGPPSPWDIEVRKRVTALLDEGMAAARCLVRRLRPAVLDITEALLERGRLDTSDAEEIVDPHVRQLRAIGPAHHLRPTPDGSAAAPAGGSSWA